MTAQTTHLRERIAAHRGEPFTAVRHRRLKAFGLIVAMSVLALSIWTASPILWLWIASQLESGGPPTMSAIAVMIVGVAGTTIAIAKGLAWLNSLYRGLYATRPTVRVHLAWLRSMRGERARETGPSVELNVLDVILILSVFVVIGLYEGWFLLFSSSPIDLRPGRDKAAAAAASTRTISSSAARPTSSWRASGSRVPRTRWSS